MISDSIRHLMAGGASIRRMWSDGLRLKEVHGPENVADMTLGNPMAEPPAELRRALEEVVAHPPPGLHRYTPNAGHPEARERVAAHLDGRGILPGATARNVIMTAGASAALNVAFRALLDPGDEVILVSPHFPDYPAHVLNHRGVPRVVPADRDFLPDPAAIDEAIGVRTRVLLLNHPNNPTGRQYPAALLRRIADLLRERSRGRERPIVLVSDEPYRVVRYAEEPFTSPASVYEESLLAYSFSKSHAIPGERIGYLALNPQGSGGAELEAALSLANRILGFTNAPVLWQHVVTRCLDASVDLGPWRSHRDRLHAALVERGYEVRNPDGTFYLFPRTPGGDDDGYVQRAMERLLLVVPGGTFGRAGHFRMAFCVDERTVDLAVDRLPPADPEANP